MPLEYHFNAFIGQKEVKQKLRKAAKNELEESNRVRKLKSGLGSKEEKSFGFCVFVHILCVLVYIVCVFVYVLLGSQS